MVTILGYRVSGLFSSFFFVLLTLRAPGDFKVTGPAQPILARVGEDAILYCQLLPKRSLMHMEVIWYRSEPSTPVLEWQGGAEVTEAQVEEYRGRVEWIEANAAEGRVALKIHNIQPSDNGKYWCRFQEGNYIGERSLMLKVAGVGSAPNIHMEGTVGSSVQLTCTAKGWFPEPQVYWEDITGEKLETLSEHHVQDADGLFYVEASLAVKAASAGTVSCFVHNHVLAEKKDSDISIPEKLQNELASLKVIGHSQPILVRVGEDIQLNCNLSPKANAQSMEVRWMRSHRFPAVYVHMDGDHVAGEQMAEYRGRTALVSKALDEGTVTLQIHDARTSDDGQYRCLFERDGVYQEASMDVKIVAVGSSPLMTVEAVTDGESHLVCTSGGWFPQPHVQWRNIEGKTVPSFSEALTQGSHGLFEVESRLLITNISAVNVTCSISNPLLGEEKMTTFSLSDTNTSTSDAALWVAPILILVLFLAARKVLINRRPNRKITKSCENTVSSHSSSNRRSALQHPTEAPGSPDLRHQPSAHYTHTWERRKPPCTQGPPRAVTPEMPTTAPGSPTSQQQPSSCQARPGGNCMKPLSSSPACSSESWHHTPGASEFPTPRPPIRLMRDQ